MKDYNIIEIRNGELRVYSDRLEYIRTGWWGTFLDYLIGNSIKRLHIILGMISMYFLWRAYGIAQEGDTILAVFWAFIALFYLHIIYRGKDFSLIPIICKEQVQEVYINNIDHSYLAPRIQVLFIDKDGKKRQRWDMLRGFSVKKANVRAKEGAKILSRFRD